MQSTNYGLRRTVPVALSLTGTVTSRIVCDNAVAFWILRQISLICAPTRNGATCTVRDSAGGIVDTSYFAGTGDVAGGDPPIYLYPGDYLELTWSQVTVAGTGICTFYYDEVLNT